MTDRASLLLLSGQAAPFAKGTGPSCHSWEVRVFPRLALRPLTRVLGLVGACARAVYEQELRHVEAEDGGAAGAGRGSRACGEGPSGCSPTLGEPGTGPAPGGTET